MWPVATGCPVCEHHTGWTESAGRGPGCLGDRNRRHNAVAHVFYDAAKHFRVEMATLSEGHRHATADSCLQRNALQSGIAVRGSLERGHSDIRNISILDALDGLDMAGVLTNVPLIRCRTSLNVPLGSAWTMAMRSRRTH